MPKQFRSPTGTRNMWPITASLLMTIAGLWMVTAPIWGHMGPPWPCVIAGVLIVASAAMIHQKPAQHVGWGLIVVIASVTIMLIGQGGIVAGLIGLTGGVASIVWRPESQKA